MTTETVNATAIEIERRIAVLRKIIDFETAAGNGDEVNRLRDEIGTLYQILIDNERESHERTDQ